MAHRATPTMTAAFSILALAALLMGGCGAPDRSAQQTGAPAAAAPTVAPPAALIGDRLYIRDSDGGLPPAPDILDGASGTREHTLPLESRRRIGRRCMPPRLAPRPGERRQGSRPSTSRPASRSARRRSMAPTPCPGSAWMGRWAGFRPTGAGSCCRPSQEKSRGACAATSSSSTPPSRNRRAASIWTAISGSTRSATAATICTCSNIPQPDRGKNTRSDPTTSALARSTQRRRRQGRKCDHAGDAPGVDPLARRRLAL